MAGERAGAAPYGGVADVTAAPEAKLLDPGPPARPPWIRSLSCYERRETTFVEGTRYG
jgi:hypothetical protein